MSKEQAVVYVFPPYRMDPGQRQLSRDGQSISLTPKEFDTLLVLVEAGGKVVEKEALIAQVWPDSYVGDGSLARNISVLRKELGGNVIETLPRRGYRITLPVTRISSAPVPTASEPHTHDTTFSQVSPSPVPASAPWWRRQLGIGLGLAMALLIAGVGFRFFAVNIAKAHGSASMTSPIRSILIQKEGAIDPLDEGFRLARADGNYTHIVRNRENNGFDRWRLVTDDQNHYYRALSEAEQDFAIQSDWNLTCVCALEKGAGASDIDFGPVKGPRFDMAYLQEGKRYFVVLTKQVSPEFEFDQKIEFPGVADVDHPHTYELRYDHLSRTASLWIDGQLMASGYRGYHQFQQGHGLMFGAATYLDAPISSMVFRTVRFEAR